ncbi:hypothetical protein [Mesorhizobium cantuariense]|uniref:Uncharacterized protein n=1 Tax=Mesorhizobium cantuariense TaxID=1300275 RepID=A0ABV7MSQ9_9HYPH
MQESHAKVLLLFFFRSHDGATDSPFGRSSADDIDRSNADVCRGIHETSLPAAAAEEATLLRYVEVQSFQGTPRGLSRRESVEVQSLEHALRIVEKLAANAAGMVAFSRKGDTGIGEFEDAVILSANGTVPVFEADLAIVC